jgi:hypothetical protein
LFVRSGMGCFLLVVIAAALERGEVRASV